MSPDISFGSLHIAMVTSDFVATMEEANRKSLKEFFAKWVYLQS